MAPFPFPPDEDFEEMIAAAIKFDLRDRVFDLIEYFAETGQPKVRQIVHKVKAKLIDLNPRQRQLLDEFCDQKGIPHEDRAVDGRQTQNKRQT